ncbi:hypothetical protein N9A71_04785 [Porticoccaceae bacterium]|jgi:hypothetical protein|nr:hypothetical protein [Porticoccaceae bacterium]
MPTTKISIFSALLTLFVISGCSSSTQVTVDTQFPSVVSKPQGVNAAVVFSDEFKSYIATPSSKTTIDLGKAQTSLLSNAFRGLFRELEFVSSKDDVTFKDALVITPSVQEVQVSTPSDTYLNVYEVWIKYNLDIETTSGDQVDSWFMPAYGKTPDSFMLSKTNAIEEAAIIALRDAGAKLLLDFYRIPSIYNWMVVEQKLEEQK